MGVTIADLSDSLASDRDDLTEVSARDELARAFDALSFDHRTVVVLHHLIGLPLAEIASLLDGPYGTVGSRLHHAMRQLRTQLEASGVPAPGGQPA
jgi:RNA polymerase sigma-70 factor (ECF subfamily)